MALVRKSQARTRKKSVSNFQICHNQFFYFKTQPTEDWKLQCAQFLWDQFYIFLQFVHWCLGWICPIRNRAISCPKNQNYLPENANFRFFLSYGLRTTIQIKIFSFFYVTDNFSSCYSWKLSEKIQTLSMKRFSK